MLERFYGKFVLSCSCCGEQAEDKFSKFDEVTQYMRNNGWQSELDEDNDEWQHFCPECKGK
ncbi:hypothetical protein LPY66_18285 [Dehalobacter sp. DCM]|uniref:hypothetical protein n=1 Tax=Dehalobacter sp. DCM TaxID=2907827 RepID=UPI0030819538|nr:hypothetical protein LPY66_18285 [Dehalobacter sp. DCM]